MVAASRSSIDIFRIFFFQSIIAEGKSTFQTTQETKSMLGIRTANQPVVSGDNLWFCRSILDAAPDKPMAVEEDMFPCILVMCGSATGAMLVSICKY